MSDSVSMLNGLIPCDSESVNECLNDIVADIKFYSVKLRNLYILRDLLVEKKETLEEKK